MIEEYINPVVRIVKIYSYTKLYYLLLIVFIKLWRYLYRLANTPTDPFARYITLELLYSSIVVIVVSGCAIHALWMAPLIYKLYTVIGFALLFKWLK